MVASAAAAAEGWAPRQLLRCVRPSRRLRMMRWPTAAGTARIECTSRSLA